MHHADKLAAAFVFLAALLPLRAGAEPPTAAPIIRGQLVPAGEAKYQVLVWSLSKEGAVFICGGSLLSKQWVVTAAHCFDDMQVARTVVEYGSHEIGKGTRTGVDAVKVHPRYDSKTLDYDVAVVRLSAPVSGKVDFVELGTDEVTDEVEQAGDSLFVTGWGMMDGTDESSNPMRLRGVELPVVPRRVCNAEGLFDGAITRRMICAGYHKGAHGTCSGDSGGPAVLTRRRDGVRRHYLIGVTSFGSLNCDEYSGFTRVSAVRAWIRDTIRTDEN
jgi:secreted trypsin-like serine protease